MAKKFIDSPTVAWDSHSGLVTAGQGVLKSATISQSSGMLDTTAITGSQVLSKSYLGDLTQTTVALAGRMDPALLGSSIGLNWTNGYTANLNAATVNLNWGAIDITSSSPSAVGYQYGPGLLDCTFSFEYILDDTATFPTTGDSGAATLTVTDADGDTVTLAGTLFVENVGEPLEIGTYPTVTVSARLSGNLTLGGDESGTLYDDLVNGSSLFANPGEDTLTITESTGVAHSGEAFVSSMSVTHAIGQPVSFSVTAQVSGAWTWDTGA